MPDPGVLSQPAASLPTGYQAYVVAGVTYVVYVMDPGQGASVPIYYRHDKDLPGPVVDADDWSLMTRDWVEGGTTAGMVAANEAGGGSFQDIVDSFTWNAGARFTKALSDPTVVAVAAKLFANPDMSTAELDLLLEQTDTFQSTTQEQKIWNDLSEADRQAKILTTAQELLSLWANYVDEDEAWASYSKPSQPGLPAGDPGVSINELRSANPDLYRWAEKVASGKSTQITAVNEWMKPTALGVENSPYNRFLEQERRARGASGVAIAANKGSVVDLYNRYGIDITEGSARELGRQMYMNEVALDDLEERVKNESQTVWANKPRDMDFVSWANPFLELYASTLETSAPTFRDPMVAEYLQGADTPTLSEFKRKLRGDERWQYTKNARDAYHTTYSQIGRLMGFV